MKQFTLIELITGIVIFSIVTVGTAVFIQNMLASVKNPEITISRSSAFRSVCHNIRNDHNTNFRTNLAGIKTKIGNEGTQQDNSYGRYRVIENRYVTFTQNLTSYTEQPAASSNFLKVKIADYQGRENGLLLLSGGNDD